MGAAVPALLASLPTGEPVAPSTFAPLVPIVSDVDLARRLPDGVVWGVGWDAEGILGDHDPVRDWDASLGAGAWPEHLRARRLLVLPDEPFVETAVVGLRPAPCYHVHRSVTDVDVGLDDPIGSRIEQELLAWLEPPYFSGEVMRRDDPRCAGRHRSTWGFALEEVHRVVCELPGRDVRCFRVGSWSYHLGERDTRWSADLVFDVVTGERLDVTEIVTGLGASGLRQRVDTLVCLAGGTCAGVTWRDGQVLPTRAGVEVRFAPGEADDVHAGTRRLDIPWSVLGGVPATVG